MSHGYERVVRRLFYAALIVCILLDGGMHYFGASVSTILFSAVLAMSVWIDFHRVPLKDIRRAALAVGLGLVAVALVQSGVIPGASFHAVWDNLSTLPGLPHVPSPAVNRSQPLWELPGTVLPFVAVAAAVPIFRTAHDARNLWVTIALLGTGFAAYGFVQKAVFPTWHFFLDRDAYLDSLTGFYVNRNAAAAFLFMTAVVTIDVLDHHLSQMDMRNWRAERALMERGPRRTALAFGLMLLLQVVAILTTRSRFGLLYVLLGLLPWAGYRLWHHLRRGGYRPDRRTITIAAVIAVVFLGFAAEQVLFRLEVQGADDENRLCIYSSVLSLISDNLWIGTGLGTFVEAFPPYRRPECGLHGVWETAHDTYLQGLATMGLLFVPFFLVVGGVVIRALRTAWRASSSARVHVLPVAIVGCALALHSLVDFPLEIPGNAILFGLLVVSTVGRATDPRRLRGRRTRSGHRSAAGAPPDERPTAPESAALIGR